MAIAAPKNYESVGQPLAALAEALPEHLAFVYLDDEEREHKITYRGLHERALGVAHQLLATVRRGDRALLLLPPGLDFVAAIFGCFHAGVIGVPAPPPSPRRLERTLGRLLRIAEDADTVAVLTLSPFVDAARKAIPSGHKLIEAQWITVDTCSPSTNTSGIVAPGFADVAFLQYTSGSTADPRGVKLTHSNLLHNSRVIAAGFDHDPELSSGFNWIPPYHDMGLIGAILHPVCFFGHHLDDAAQGRDPARAASVLTSPLAVVKRPIRWLRSVSRYQATTSGGPNFSYDMCVQRISQEECATLDLSSWEVAFNGAEPIRAETMVAFAEKFRPQGFRSSAFFPVYGLAEATLMVTSPTKSVGPMTQRFDASGLLDNRLIPGEDENDPLLVSCGAPYAHHRVEIVDPDKRILTAPGKIGEIWVSGPSVGDGYWGEDASRSRLFDAELTDVDDADRFLRTGDLGAFHEGVLFVVGRMSDLIILQGRNHHPHDVESLAEEVEPLLVPHASAAFELQEEGGKPGVALVGESSTTDLATLREAIDGLKRKVAGELGLPLALVAICERGAVPKTTSGKIQRRLCRSLLLAGELEVLAEWRQAGGAVGGDIG